MSGFTGNDFVWALLNTGIFTWTVTGLTRTGLRWLPRLSTGMRGTSRSTKSPWGSMTTSACAATTNFTTESGPETVTVGWLRTGSPTSRFSGGAPVLTRTGTVYDVY